MKNIVKTVILITLFTAFTRLSGFIFRIFMSRIIGAEALGIYQIAFSVFASLVTICCSGIPLSVSRLSAKYSELKQTKTKYSITTSALIIALTSSIFLCSIILIFNNILANLFTSYSCMLILLTLLPAVVFSSVHGVIRGYLWGEDDYLWVCIIELVEQYIRIIACSIALSFAYTTLHGALSASISLTIAIFISCILILIIYKKKGGKYHLSTRSFKEVLSSSTPVTALRFLSSLVQPLISLIIPFCLVQTGYTNEQALTLFGVSMGMAFPLIFLPTTIIDSLSITLISSLARAKATQNTAFITEQVAKSFTFASFIACLCLPIFASLGEPICSLLFNSALAGQFLSKSSIAIIPFSLSGITTSILNSLEQEKKTFKYYMLSSLIMIALLFVLPYFVGIDAIIIALTAQCSIICLCNLLLIKKLGYLTLPPIILLFKMFLIAIVYALITFLLFDIMQHFFPLFINLIFCASFCSLLYLYTIQLLKLYNIKPFINRLLKKKSYPLA